MRREDTIPFLHEFLQVRPAPLLARFAAWWEAKHDSYIKHRYGCVVDHLGFKCRSVGEYEEVRSRFEEHLDGWRASRFIHQSIISGRRVAVIGLVVPIPTALGPLRVLELSEPKAMKAERYGFDHLEIWPRYVQSSIAAEIFSAPLAADDGFGRFVRKDRPHHVTWDAEIPGDAERNRPSFILRLTDDPLIGKIGQEMR